MAYNQNIPLATDKIKDSQSDIQNNFQAIKTAWDINHVTFDDGDQGKHKFLQMPEQGVAVTTAANEAALYAAQGVFSSVAELIFRRESDGTTIPFTEGINSANGWARLGSGLLIKWAVGSISAGVASGTSSINHTWATGATIPAFSSQFWGISVPKADPASVDKDVNCVAYITDLSNPARITYRLWRRNQFNVKGTDQGPLEIYHLAFGLE